MTEYGFEPPVDDQGFEVRGTTEYAETFEPHEADATWFEVQKREPNYQGRWVSVTTDTFEDYKSCEARRKVYQAADEFGLYRSKKVRGQE